jgi:hypothetical protein|tara:strand:+ start:599 stop:982 length:384 start_codon:yes stop_codon:yes gene_type:complete
MKSSKNKAIMSKKSNGVGRPKILLDVKKIAELSKLQCTLEEIAAVLGVHRTTLIRNYAQIIDDNRELGKTSLRRSMWKKAINKDNTNMQIWLSKNVLGYKDKIESKNITEPLPLIIDGKAEDVEEVK